MPFTAENFCSLLSRSRLHSSDAAAQQLRRWRAGAKDKTSAKEFADWLVGRQALTAYQAKHLLAGHADSLCIDQYKLLERIGKGRMAGVYQAVHTSRQMVALKILPPAKAKEADVLARFQREARLATQLNHPNIIRTYHAGEANGLHYLVMEYVDGDTLEVLLRERRTLPAREAVRIAFLAALGLEHIHEKEMVHRDLKPGNLMLAPFPGKGENTLRSMVKLMDIGLGKALFAGDDSEGEVTVQGDVVGTPDYLAPEQARDARRADIRSDIYSLGCTLYHMLAGQPPFPDENSVRQILRHATEAPRPLRQFKPETPEGLQQIVDKMLAKEPAQRYQSPRQVAEALRGFLAAESEPARTKPVSAEEKNYEEWLDKAIGDKPRKETAAAAPVESRPASDAEEDAKERRTRKKPPPRPDEEKPVLVSDVQVARSALIEVDVEPVNETDLRRSPFNFPLHRDVFMIAVGALGVLFIVLVIWLVKLLLGGSETLPIE